MDFTINEKTLCNLLNDELYSNEIVSFLNSVIDEELEKDDMDCDFIDECINAIDEITEYYNSAPAIRLMLTEKRVMSYCKKHSRNNGAVRAVIAACLVMVIGGTALFHTSPAVAKSSKEFFEVVISSLQQMADITDSNDSTISSIYASFPENTVFKAKDIDSIDLSEIKITAIYNDNSTKEIPISDCKITKSIEKDENNKSVALVVIAYNGCACSVVYQIEG
ncbi:MAG: hypothetical protein ACLUFN_02815 [Eubacterium sp.]